MIITTLEVHNFKSIHDITMSFDKGLNVITGKNESGKSNFLNAIKFALDDNSIVQKDLVNFEKENATIKLSLRNENFNTDNYTIYKEIDKDNRINSRIFTHNENPNNELNCLLLDTNSHCHLSAYEMKNFANNLKEKSKTTQIIIVSNSPEILYHIKPDLYIQLENTEDKGTIPRRIIRGSFIRDYESSDLNNEKENMVWNLVD